LIEAKMSERKNIFRKLKLLFKEFGFTARILKDALAESCKKS
tara:strand:- start:167 stop:292 length:126 start_codon:yes stop_codon:yes gene_type:complete